MLPEPRDDLPQEFHDPLEVRASPRVATDLPARLRIGGIAGELPARVRDVGVGGLCVATATPFALKSLDQVVVEPPDAAPLVLPVEGSWQRELEGEDLILSGLSCAGVGPAELDGLWDLMFAHAKVLARFLHERTPLVELGIEDAMGLAALTRYRQVSSGRFVYRQDQPGDGADSIFIVNRGAVGLQVRAREAREIPTERLEVGELFGGLPLLADLPHAESAIALRDTRLLEIDAASFKHLRMVKPWLGYRLSRVLLRTSAARLQRLARVVRDEL